MMWLRNYSKHKASVNEILIYKTSPMQKFLFNYLELKPQAGTQNLLKQVKQLVGSALVCLSKLFVLDGGLRRPAILWLLLLIGLLVTACGRNEAQPLTILPTNTAAPTPTLAAGLPTIPPPPPTLAANPDTAVAVATESTTAASTVTAVIIPTVTPFPTPTNTPAPVERIELAHSGLTAGNYQQTINQLEAVLVQPAAATPAQQADNLYSLGIAYLGEDRYSDAALTFERLQTDFPDLAPSAAYYHLGQAYQRLANYAGAIEAYQAYLAVNSDMGAYVYLLIATAYTAAGDTVSSQIALETAAAAPAHRLTEISNRRMLAELYMEAANYPAAAAQYDAIRNAAVTQFTQGEMNYLAGYAELLNGETEAAYGRFQQSLAAYPNAFESYLGLVELVNAGIPVDEYQRGLVNFNAKSYDPTIAAFDRYLQANPENHNPEAYLYKAWAYEASGNLTTALLELDSYTNSHPAEATIERGKMLTRAGDVNGAFENYQFYLTNFPTGEAAPFAAWRSAAIAEGAGNIPTAISGYTFLADNFPWHEDTPEALFHAGWLANNGGDIVTAVTLWNRAAQTYPANEYGSAADVWLLQTLPGNETVITGTLPSLAEVQQRALANTAVNYYAFRAKDMAAGNNPFTANAPIHLPTPEEEAAAQTEAEIWLRGWLGLESGTDIRSLPSQLANDPRLIRGEKLWQLGEHEFAKRELETVRTAAAQDALASYQLALYFRDLGLYRSSILAAMRLPILAGQSTLEMPPFIGRLLYPVYYADLVLPLAKQYGYDPRLQFALLRQESLFESFATSSAVAQGLSQVIPDTGAYIAQRLNWPNYENKDLYKPYVGLNFGAYYLSQQLNAFDGNVHAALSAYNAGPGNAARWYETAGADLDSYHETVDFAETRLYIERIYEGYDFYRILYGE
ncbi:MAG: transglycosylase SLT domain-containing protein [Chloroflexi bacterium]|nr:transglycosylase SLT domain-containing protein [Chloroflexota bacterium]